MQAYHFLYPPQPIPILYNIKGIIDTSGNLVVKYEYDAWGKCTITQDTDVISPYDMTLGNLNPIRYKGYYYDNETELYYLINRYYDPATGRFISVDSTEYLDFAKDYGTNLFVYCNNNPVMGYDPTGTDAILITDYTLDIVGHAIVLIQDENGVWYLTEFNPSKTWIWCSGNVTTFSENSLEKNADPAKLKRYLYGNTNANIFRTEGFVKTYIEGDFSASVKLALEYQNNGGVLDSYTNFSEYNLFTNNCSDYANVILNEGTASDPHIEQKITDLAHETDVSIPIGDHEKIINGYSVTDNILSVIGWFLLGGCFVRIWNKK